MMTSTELMPVVMIIPLLYIEANKINMASYVLTDLSGHCERELFFILVVAMAESEGPSVSPKSKRQNHFDASWIQEFQGIGESNESQSHL